MFQATLAQHIQHTRHLAIPILGQGHQYRAHPQHFFNVNQSLVQRIIRVVQLVHEQDCPHAGLTQFLKSGYRLGFHAAGSTHHQNGAFHGRQGRIYLGTKVYMPRRIDKVKPGILPLKMGDAALDGNASVLLFGQVVHSGKALFHTPRATHLPGREQNPFRQGSLTRIHVGKDGDIADRLRHLGPYFFSCDSRNSTRAARSA